MSGHILLGTCLVAVDESVRKTVNLMLPIARDTLRREGSHSPTAVLHTIKGAIPVLMTFQDQSQRRDQLEQVKMMAVEENAFAVSAITCAKIIDHRLNVFEEALVVATTVRGLRPHIVTQAFSRDTCGNIAGFSDPVEGEDAWVVGQMMIFPDWDLES